MILNLLQVIIDTLVITLLMINYLILILIINFNQVYLNLLKFTFWCMNLI